MSQHDTMWDVPRDPHVTPTLYANGRRKKSQRETEESTGESLGPAGNCMVSGIQTEYTVRKGKKSVVDRMPL